MRSVGLVVEYNPFHNGHLYHLRQAKKITGADLAIAVMSGNFTQRGEPTILDKWTRTQIALDNGIDLVVELPVFFAVQPAHRFASGALQILHALHVKQVVFGAEHADWPFEKLVQAENSFSASTFQQYDQTYATQFNQQMLAATGISLKDPNDILAYAYFKTVMQAGWDMQLKPISRLGSDYHDAEIEGTLSSAKAIRRAVANKEWDQLSQTVPTGTFKALKTIKQLPDWNQLYPILRNHLIQAKSNNLRQTYMMAEGLENRLKEDAAPNLDFDSFLKAAKTKRYTYSHLERLFCYLALEASQTEVDDAIKHPYIRILGFNDLGRTYLHEIKKKAVLPIITKVGQDLHHGLLDLDYRAGKLYQNFTKIDQDVTHPPITSLSSIHH